MTEEAKGSEELMSWTEAREHLGGRKEYIDRLINQKILIPVYGKQRLPMFRRETVERLAELREANRGLRFDLPEVAIVAEEAQVRSLRTEKRLQELERFIGMDSVELALDEKKVQRLHQRAKEAKDAELTAGLLIEWAHIIQAIDEHYLCLTERYTGSPSPWFAYYDLINHLIKSVSPDQSGNLAMKFARSLAKLARKHLRQVTYFYIRDRHSVQKAEEAVPELSSNPVDHLTPYLRLILQP